MLVHRIVTIILQNGFCHLDLPKVINIYNYSRRYRFSKNTHTNYASHIKPLEEEWLLLLTNHRTSAICCNFSQPYRNIDLDIELITNISLNQGCSPECYEISRYSRYNM